MESFESKPSRVEEAKRVIANAPDRVEAEFIRSSNTWMECFGSSIFALETYLDSDIVRGELGESRYTDIMKKIEILKERHSELKEKFPDRNTVPPEEIKQELLNLLKVI